MKKKIISILLIFNIIIICSACSNNDRENIIEQKENINQDISIGNLNEEEIVEVEDISDNIEKNHQSIVKSNIISDNWIDLEFLLDGYKFDLDDSLFHDYEILGWSFKDELYENPNLLAEMYASTYMKMFNEKYDTNDNESILMFLPINYTNVEKKASQCNVRGISIQKLETEENKTYPEFEIANGICIGDNIIDVFRAFGPETKKTRDNEIEIYTYEDIKGTMRFYVKNNIINKIELEKNI